MMMTQQCSEALLGGLSVVQREGTTVVYFREQECENDTIWPVLSSLSGQIPPQLGLCVTSKKSRHRIPRSLSSVHFMGNHIANFMSDAFAPEYVAHNTNAMRLRIGTAPVRYSRRTSSCVVVESIDNDGVVDVGCALTACLGLMMVSFVGKYVFIQALEQCKPGDELENPFTDRIPPRHCNETHIQYIMWYIDVVFQWMNEMRESRHTKKAIARNVVHFLVLGEGRRSWLPIHLVPGVAVLFYPYVVFFDGDTPVSLESCQWLAQFRQDWTYTNPPLPTPTVFLPHFVHQKIKEMVDPLCKLTSGCVPIWVLSWIPSKFKNIMCRRLLETATPDNVEIICNNLYYFTSLSPSKQHVLGSKTWNGLLTALFTDLDSGDSFSEASPPNDNDAE